MLLMLTINEEDNHKYSNKSSNRISNNKRSSDNDNDDDDDNTLAPNPNQPLDPGGYPVPYPIPTPRPWYTLYPPRSGFPWTKYRSPNRMNPMTTQPLEVAMLTYRGTGYRV